eukprot:1138119-Pelagomonas_calceolata.AAC.3
MSCTAVQGKGAWSGCAFGIAQRPPPSMTRGWHECTCSCAGLCAQSKGSIWAGTWARFKPRTPAENEDKDWKLKINVRQQALAWLGHSCRVTLHEQRFSNRFLQSCCCGSQQGPPPFPAKPLAQQH